MVNLESIKVEEIKQFNWLSLSWQYGRPIQMIKSRFADIPDNVLTEFHELSSRLQQTNIEHLSKIKSKSIENKGTQNVNFKLSKFA